MDADAASDDLEVAWVRRFPQHANVPIAFERYRHGLIARDEKYSAISRNSRSDGDSVHLKSKMVR
jgi:hypothetical protein